MSSKCHLLVQKNPPTIGDLIDSENTWQDIYGIKSNGAVLVRPDGHVAWRSISMVDEPLPVLEKYFNTIFNDCSV